MGKKPRKITRKQKRYLEDLLADAGRSTRKIRDETGRKRKVKKLTLPEASRAIDELRGCRCHSY